MAQTVTQKHLEALALRLNQLTGNDPVAWKHEGSRNVASVGNYHISGQYGGVSLEQMMNESGSVRTVFGTTTKRELADLIRAYMAGMQDVREVKRNPRTKKQSVTVDDMNAAIRGIGMNRMGADELRELVKLHHGDLFADRVITAAAKHVLHSKRRVGLLQKNPLSAHAAAIMGNTRKKRVSALDEFSASMHARERLPMRASVERTMRRLAKPRRDMENRVAVQFHAHGVWATVKTFPNTVAGRKAAKAYATKAIKKIPHTFRAIAINQ